MRIFDFVSVKLTLLLIFGIILGFYLEPQLLSIFLILILSLALLGWTWRIQKFFLWPLASSMVCIGIFITAIALGQALPNHYSHFDMEETGVWQLKIIEVLKPNPYQERYIAKVNAFERKQCIGKLILNISKDSSLIPFQVDNEVVLLAKLDELQSPLNPHQFDYKDYLKKQGIHHKITISPESILKKKKTRGSLFGTAMKIRESIIKNLSQEKFGKDEFGVIQALLLGKRDDISEETYTNYKNAGAVHILAVSGLHVGVLLLLFQFLLKPLTFLPKGETIHLGTVVLLLWAYAFLAGLSPSVVRAVTMFSFLAYAQYLNRPTNSFNIIALSMFFILLMHPLVLFQVGFQMSYAAVFAIVWIYPKLQRFWFPDHFLVRKTWQLFSVSLAAQLGVLPISLFYFHQFPILFFVSNLLIIPFLGVILGTGILTMILSLANLLPEPLVIGYNYSIRIMNAIVSWVADQESFVFKEIPLDGFQMTLLYVLFISFVLVLSKPKFKSVLMLSLAVIGLQVLGVRRAFHLQNSAKYLIVHSSKASVLLHQHEKHLTSYTSDSTLVEKMTINFKIGEHLELMENKSIGNALRINSKQIYRVDSFAVFPIKKDIDVLWLSQSPKINLERWLDSLKPKKVIMDGTNYRTHIKQWKKTCINKKIPFHDTREKGAYVFK
ncbi:ComEC/Rec2 family competence protein [Flagellimonas meridianipacifica]|uniref:Competence protein ComEC n=1 Tax=Flagellimonas meridianipacifica TaxID=1080225 RepID=A0A2T0MFL5_9FLAO|nr:ComEC/Rec2 family competence protein [Allomuricauda pacifica]PRX56352.1 competence protein ComEC [Allomuricauda pacifica]